MSRIYVITGAASGIGKSAKEILEQAGNKVVGVDIHDSDVIGDLSSPEGRKLATAKVLELAGGKVDAVIANAGSALSEAKTVSINFFGSTAFVESLHDALSKSSAPRVAFTSSMASLMPNDPQLVELMLSGDESASLVRAEELVKTGGGAEALIYGSTKRAMSRWIRRECIKSKWAGMGIPMNAVGPGIVKTPMVAEMIATQEGRDALAQVVPMPLNGYLEPSDVAQLLVWLTSPENNHATGQTIYIDGGSDAVLRGDNIWDLK